VDCREAEGLLGAYYDRELEPAVLTSVRDHVATCAACHRRLANVESLGRMIRRVHYYQAPEALRARLAQGRTRSTAVSHPLAWAAAVVMAVGVAVLASSAAFLQPLGIKANMYWALLAMLTAPVLWRCGVAISDPTPQNVQDAVKRSILTLIWLDAATVAAFAQPIDGIPLFAVAVAALLVPALLLGKWVYST